MLPTVVPAYSAVPGVAKMGFSLNRKRISSRRVDLICRFVAGPWDAGSRNGAHLLWAARCSGLSTGAPERLVDLNRLILKAGPSVALAWGSVLLKPNSVLSRLLSCRAGNVVSSGSFFLLLSEQMLNILFWGRTFPTQINVTYPASTHSDVGNLIGSFSLHSACSQAGDHRLEGTRCSCRPHA